MPSGAHAAFDLRWLIGALDARIPRFEDSTTLLFRDRSALAGLAALQRDRLESRVHEAAAVDLRPGWSQRPILIAWGAAVVLIAAILLWPASNGAQTKAAASTHTAAGATAPLLTGARLRITPPAYTGLPVREQTALDARVPEGSRVEWLIDFAPQPSTAGLEFPENTPVSLIRDGTRWTGARIVDRPLLYRIEAAGLAQQRLNRLDAVADAEPVVRLVEPESQLVQLTPGQTTLDPGVRGQRRLRRHRNRDPAHHRHQGRRREHHLRTARPCPCAVRARRSSCVSRPP